MSNAEKAKKPVYKRAWFWLLLSPFIFAVLFVITATVIGIAGGFDGELNQQIVGETQPEMQVVAITTMPTLQPTFTPTIVPNRTPNPTETATPTDAPKKTPKQTSTPTLPPTPTPTRTPTQTPKPTPTLTPKPTIKPTPTIRPTPTPSPTLDPADAPYGVDINGNPGPDFVTLITIFETRMEEYVGKDVEISFYKEDWEIGKSNFRYIITTSCKIDYRYYDVIMKIEFDETYETYEVFQLKINGVNIDL